MIYHSRDIPIEKCIIRYEIEDKIRQYLLRREQFSCRILNRI